MSANATRDGSPRQHSWLLLQHIDLGWPKNCGGSDHASQRRHRPRALPLPAGFFDYPAFSNPEEAFPFHEYTRWPTPQGFREQSERIIGPTQKEVGAVAIHFDGEQFTLEYDDGLKGGPPHRRVWDPQLQSYLAPLRHSMALKTGEYTRIAYNSLRYHGRRHELHIVNALVMTERAAPLDVFCSREPDKNYEQISMLL